MYRNVCRRICAMAAVVAAALLLTQPLATEAAGVYTNPENGYHVVLEDDADLLTDSQERELAEQMQAITAYGGAAFKTIDRNDTTAGEFAKQYYAQIFGKGSGILFLIDMRNRKIWIYCDGAVYRTITRDYADTITDNVYTYAMDGDYYKCASRAFAQALTLLQGGRIARPMKFICNALLAVICALLINYFLASFLSRAAKTSDKEMLAHIEKRFTYTKPTERFLRETKRYNPVSRDGGSSDSGSSGGGGGGGSSGGGGGHSF